MNWAVVLNSLVALMAGSGGAAAINALRNRRTNREVNVAVADRVNDMALEWARAVQQDAAAARAETKQARAEMEELYRLLQSARREVDTISRRFTLLHRAIMAPSATLEELRLLAISQQDPGNGK